MNNSLFGGALTGIAGFLNAVDGFMTDSSIDVMYKTFAVVGVLFGFYAIPVTRRFTVWVAAILVMLLVIQSQPNTGAAAPPDSSLPLPTQVNTPVPPTSQVGSSGGSGSQGSSGGGFNPLTLLPIIGSLFGL